MPNPIGPSGPPSTPPSVPPTDAESKSKTETPAENTQAQSNTLSGPDTNQVSEHQWEGKMMSFAIQAQAEKELPPVGKNQQVDITDPDMKNQMLRSAPQVNDISKREGNSNDICGGAALTNGLILSSKTPEQAQANAKAVRELANSYVEADKANKSNKPFTIKPEEDAALKHMEAGKMSPADTENMQQLMDRIGHRQPQLMSNPSGLGLSTSQVAGTMTRLSALGAFKGSDVKLQCNTLPTGFDHWTVSVDRTWANSASGAPDYNKSVVHGGPPSETQKGNPNWQNEIILANSETPPKVYTQFKQPGDTNQYREATFDTSQYKDLSAAAQFEKEMRRAADAPPIPIQ